MYIGATVVLKVVLGLNRSASHPSAPPIQVVYDCGKLPLSLGLAAPLLKGPPQYPKSWRTLHKVLCAAMTSRLGTNRVMTVPAGVDAFLNLSIGAMAGDPVKQKRCLFIAVLASGTLARFDVLQDLWDEVRRRGVGSVRGAILFFFHHLFFVEALFHKRVKACIVMPPPLFLLIYRECFVWILIPRIMVNLDTWP